LLKFQLREQQFSGKQPRFAVEDVEVVADAAAIPHIGQPLVVGSRLRKPPLFGDLGAKPGVVGKGVGYAPHCGLNCLKIRIQILLALGLVDIDRRAFETTVGERLRQRGNEGQQPCGP
jgi:hypothetical protein